MPATISRKPTLEAAEIRLQTSRGKEMVEEQKRKAQLDNPVTDTDNNSSHLRPHIPAPSTRINLRDIHGNGRSSEDARDGGSPMGLHQLATLIMDCPFALRSTTSRRCSPTIPTFLRPLDSGPVHGVDYEKPRKVVHLQVNAYLSVSSVQSTPTRSHGSTVARSGLYFGGNVWAVAWHVSYLDECLDVLNVAATNTCPPSCGW